MERISKEVKERVMDAVSGDYEISWDNPSKLLKKKSEVKKGRISRARGARFELKVRENLEAQKWIMDKWTNNLDLEEDKIVKAKRKYNPFMKLMVIGTGFPDFIAFKKTNKKNYDVIGVEVKMNGILSKIEKEKCRWYLKNEIFSKILIAKKGEKRGEIEYIDFKERYGE